jgi:hypothetical protein
MLLFPNSCMQYVYHIQYKYLLNNQRDLFHFRFYYEISQQPENCENRNDPDLVQAFLKKWWVESDFKEPNLPLALRFMIFCIALKLYFLAVSVLMH